MPKDKPRDTSPQERGKPQAEEQLLDEKRIRELLDVARQKVKHIVQQELEGENVSADLLNLRLK